MIIRDHFQNYKRYTIPPAQLIIADIPYNLGNNAYASNPAWYQDGDNKNGESSLAGSSFFDTDEDFRPAEFMHFCSKMLKAEPKKVKAEGECFVNGKGGMIYLDDVGSESTPVKHYGTDIHWFKDFIEVWYAKKHPFNKLIISTNLSKKQIEEKYGYRVRSRMEEMFNIIDVNGEDLRL